MELFKQPCLLTAEQKKMISDLIKKFTDCHWTWDGNIPKISITNGGHPCSTNLYEKQENSWENEGEIVLYSIGISAFAEAFIEYDSNEKDEEGNYVLNADLTQKKKSSKLTKEKAIEMLETIVLIDTFCRWIIHWLPDSNNKRYEAKMRDSLLVEQNFHNGIAQYFNWLMIDEMRDKTMKEMVEWFYKKDKVKVLFEEIKKYRTKYIISAIEFCREVGYHQEWEFFKKVISVFSENELYKENSEQNWNYYLKTIEPNIRKKFIITFIPLLKSKGVLKVPPEYFTEQEIQEYDTWIKMGAWEHRFEH